MNYSLANHHRAIWLGSFLTGGMDYETLTNKYQIVAHLDSAHLCHDHCISTMYAVLSDTITLVSEGWYAVPRSLLFGKEKLDIERLNKIPCLEEKKTPTGANCWRSRECGQTKFSLTNAIYANEDIENPLTRFVYFNGHDNPCQVLLSQIFQSMSHEHDAKNNAYFHHPNFYIDLLDEFLTPEESKVLTHAIREILGWNTRRNTKTARIALSVFLRGKIDKRTGEKVYGGVNLNRHTLIKILDTLHQYTILCKTGKVSDPRGQQYTLIEQDMIDWKGLRQRKATIDTQNQQRTQRARNAKHQASAVTQHEYDTGAVTQHEHEQASAVTQHEYQCCPTTLVKRFTSVVGQTQRNTEEERQERHPPPPPPSPRNDGDEEEHSFFVQEITTEQLLSQLIHSFINTTDTKIQDICQNHKTTLAELYRACYYGTHKFKAKHLVGWLESGKPWDSAGHFCQENGQPNLLADENPNCQFLYLCVPELLSWYCTELSDADRDYVGTYLQNNHADWNSDPVLRWNDWQVVNWMHMSRRQWVIKR